MIGELSNHLWQSTVFVAFAAVLAVALRKNGAHVRYLIWLTASMKFLVPFSLLMALGSQWTWTRPAVTAADVSPIDSASVVVDQIARPFAAASSVAAAPQSPINWTPIVLAGLWAVGCIAIVVMRLRGWSRVRAAVRASVPWTHAGVDLPPGIDIRSAPGLLEPGIVGLWHPVLLLPAGIHDHLTPMQLEAVLAHELCHIRRRDNVTSAVHMIVEAVFWFHPLVWWIGARMVDERERACDEHVLRVLGKPEAYAEGILNVCKLYVESPLRCVSGVTGSNLKQRIEAIMINRVGLRLNVARKTAIACATVLALAAPVIVGMITAPVRAAAFVKQQPMAEKQSFEVASIKPCSPGAPLPTRAGGGPGGGAGPGGGFTFNTTPGRVHIECARLALLVETAYIQHNHDTKAFDAWAGTGSMSSGIATGPVKVRGGPSWVYDERWTIEAKAATAADEDTMLGPMLRALLEDRFRLTTRTETEEAPMWTLGVAKGGLKIKPMKDDGCNPDRTGEGILVSRAIKEGIKPTCGMVSAAPNGANWQWEQGGRNLGSVASMLGVDLGAAVLDRTGITDKFNIVFEYGPDENTPKIVQVMERFAPASGLPTAANIFTALEEQLGLKLDKIKGQRAFMVIDRVERPAPDEVADGSVRKRP